MKICTYQYIYIVRVSIALYFYKLNKLPFIHFLYQDSTPKDTSTSQTAPSSMNQMFKTMSLGERAFYIQSAKSFLSLLNSIYV